MNPEAIEAAAKASWGGNWDEADEQWKAVYRQEARIHLEAAAPFLMAAATYTHEESYAEGWDAAKSYYEGEARAAELETAAEAIPDSVYTATVNATLRARAAAIRAGEA